MSYPLIMEFIDFQLEPLEEKIYQEHFKNYLSKRNFKNLMSKATLRFFSEDSEITHCGNSFNCMYYIAFIRDDVEVNISREGNFIDEISENSWIGIVEIMEYLKMDKKQKKKIKIKSLAQISGNFNLKWLIDCKIKRKCNFEDINLNQLSQERRAIIEKYPEVCWVYCFELSQLEKFYEEEGGIFARNSMFSIWLNYASIQCLKLDNKLIKLAEYDSDNQNSPEKKSESKSFIVPQDFPKEKNIDDQEEMSKILDAR